MAGLFVHPPFARAQIGLVQVTSCGEQSFPSNCTIPTTGNGHLIAVAWKSAGGTGTAAVITSMSDNAGNSYGEAGAAKSTDSIHNAILDIWYAKNSIGGATSLTITTSPPGIVGSAVIWEFSGIDTASPLDGTAVLNNQAASASPSGAKITTTSADEVIISAVNSQNAKSGIYPGNVFTNDSMVDGAGWAHLITTSTGAYGAQWNQSTAGTYASSTASFIAEGSISACDLNQDKTVNVLDVELATDMALAPTDCRAPFGQCNPAFVQAVLASAMPGGACIIPVVGAPSSVSFGNVMAGSSSTQTVTLTGAGTASSTISKAMVSGSAFGISGLSLPLTLPVGHTRSFNVTFAPATTGNISGSVVLVSNALDPTVILALSGTGVAAASHGESLAETEVPATSPTVALSWTPSTSSNVTSYNIYRTTVASPVITSPTKASGTVGTAFSYEITATNTPTSYGAKGLPAGLSVSSTTGLISGTPATAGTSTVTLSATNASGTGNATLTLTIGTATRLSFVQIVANAASGSASSLSLSFPSNTVAGDLILVAFDYNTSAIPSSVTDSQGNIFTPVGNQLSSPGGSRSRVYYANNIKGGADTVTVNLSANSGWLELYLTEYSGVSPTNPIDAEAGASGNAGTVSSGNVTTTMSGDMVYGYCVGDWACTAGSGFATRSNFNSNLIEDEQAGKAGAYAATGSANQGWTMQLVALKPASPVPGLVPMSTSGTTAAGLIRTSSSDDIAATNTPTSRAKVLSAGFPVKITTVPPQPYPILNSISATTCGPTVCTYIDTAVQAGQTYWYYATAINNQGGVSVPSNIVEAQVPAQ